MCKDINYLARAEKEIFASVHFRCLTPISDESSTRLASQREKNPSVKEIIRGLKEKGSGD